MPQVHGIVHETLDFVKQIVSRELNAATDNPMVFPDAIISAGNFHGEYPAKVSGRASVGGTSAGAVAQLLSCSPCLVRVCRPCLATAACADLSTPPAHPQCADYLAMAVSELATISERRIERLINQHLSGPNPPAGGGERLKLPPFLVREPGLNSGFMILHCTAAALVVENRTLVHPTSCDSISTSAAQEDHVSMGAYVVWRMGQLSPRTSGACAPPLLGRCLRLRATFRGSPCVCMGRRYAARKCLNVVENVERVLAIELMAACQGIDFLRPLKSTDAIERVHSLVRTKVPFWDEDMYASPHMEVRPPPPTPTASTARSLRLLRCVTRLGVPTSRSLTCCVGLDTGRVRPGSLRQGHDRR